MESGETSIISMWDVRKQKDMKQSEEVLLPPDCFWYSLRVVFDSELSGEDDGPQTDNQEATEHEKPDGDHSDVVHNSFSLNNNISGHYIRFS